jgi:hypothetical protein
MAASEEAAKFREETQDRHAGQETPRTITLQHRGRRKWRQAVRLRMSEAASGKREDRTLGMVRSLTFNNAATPFKFQTQAFNDKSTNVPTSHHAHKFPGPAQKGDGMTAGQFPHPAPR